MTGNEAEGSRLARVRLVAERVAQSRGLEVFDVQYRRESQGWVLRVFLDRPGAAVRSGRAGTTSGDGVTVQDCQRVSDDLGTVLDVEDIIGQHYTLEVSSPGLDRPLRTPGDYERFAGCLAKIVLTDAIDGQKHLAGRLGGMEGGEVLLADSKQRIRRIPLALIARARLEVEF